MSVLTPSNSMPGFRRTPLAAPSQPTRNLILTVSYSIALLLSQESVRRENTLPTLLVIPNKACLAAVYWRMPGMGTYEFNDIMLTLTPCPRSRSTARPWHTRAFCLFIARVAYLQKKKVPFLMTLKNHSHSAELASAISGGALTPICHSSTEYLDL